MTGTVRYWKWDFGFVEPDDGSENCFLHIHSVERVGRIDLAPGTRVEFTVVPPKAGETRCRAIRARLLSNDKE